MGIDLLSLTAHKMYGPKDWRALRALDETAGQITRRSTAAAMSAV